MRQHFLCNAAHDQSGKAAEPSVGIRMCLNMETLKNALGVRHSAGVHEYYLAGLDSIA